MARRLMALALTSLLAVATPAAATEDPVFGKGARDNPAVALWLKAAWRNYVSRFVTDEGAVVDDANDGISHSESQGYGMILAVAAADEAEFRKIKQFTFETMQVREDNLFSWKVEHKQDGPAVVDNNNATDGDLLIAWALIEAYQLWNNAEDMNAAELILADIADKLVRSTGFGPVLVPGEYGFESDDRKTLTLNPSYWVFPALESISKVNNAANWVEVAVAGEEVINLSQRAPTYLPPDWVDVTGIKVEPSKKFEPEFGYNAIRIPLYLAMSASAYRAKSALDFATLEGFGAKGGPALVHVVSGKRKSIMGGTGYAAITALTRCLDRSEPLSTDLLRISKDPYYSTTLQILTILALAERYPQCLSIE